MEFKTLDRNEILEYIDAKLKSFLLIYTRYNYTQKPVKFVCK